MYGLKNLYITYELLVNLPDIIQIVDSTLTSEIAKLLEEKSHPKKQKTRRKE